MSAHDKLPPGMDEMNQKVIEMHDAGMTPGTIRVLSIPGRTSGELRTTPVSPYEVDGKRYVVAGLGDDADWAKNARAAGWGILRAGLDEEKVRLVEIPVEERGKILREFPVQVPNGVDFFTAVHGVKADPDEFEAIAPKIPTFRVEPFEE